MIFEADNVLDPDVIRAMFRIRKEIDDLVTPRGATWQEMCLRVPGKILSRLI
jgi:hypothetical protein